VAALTDGDAFFLCGYEQVADFGFALPLYKSSPHSNAWYVALAEKPYDLAARVIGFEQFHVDDVLPLDDTEFQKISVGDTWQTVFIWDGRLYIGSVETVSDKLRGKIRELRKYVPVSLIDLSLGIRSRRFKGHLVNGHKYLKTNFGRNVADNWFSHILVRQTSKLDIDAYARMTPHRPSDEHRAVIIDLISQVTTHAPRDAEVAVVYPDALGEFLDLRRVSQACFHLTGIACKVLGKSLTIRSASGEVSDLSSDAQPVPVGVVRKQVPSKSPAKSPTMSIPRALAVTVAGNKIHVGHGLREHATTMIIRTFPRHGFSQGTVSAHFSRAGHAYVCLLYTAGSPLRVTSKGRSGDIYAAFYAALAKAEEQLRRRADRLRTDRRSRSLKLLFRGNDSETD
jgi:ribosome-associated translation inhibitor RaiA